MLSVVLCASIAGCARHRTPEIAIGGPHLDVARPPTKAADRSPGASRGQTAAAAAGAPQAPADVVAPSQPSGAVRESVGTSGSRTSGAAGTGGSVTVTTVPNPTSSGATPESAPLLGQTDRPHGVSTALVATIVATAFALGSIAWYRRRRRVRS